MIKYTLVCDHRHTFESWFANSETFDKQVKRKLVTCPVCDSAKVEKALMAPRLNAKGNRRKTGKPEAVAAMPTPAAAPGLSRGIEAARLQRPDRDS